jgi:HTH-type transcriptional regulator/antitoxin HipB
VAKQTTRLNVPLDIGNALQQARLAQGLSQVMLAQQLGLPQSVISDIESGKSTILVRRILGIARELGLDLTASWEDNAPRN